MDRTIVTNHQNTSQQARRLIDEIKSEINPFYHPICLSQPLRIASSFWFEHIPFAMFLIDFIRPRTVVELGSFTGVSYCAFCQAVKALDLDTQCYAVDNWQGDNHNGFYGDEVLHALKEHHDPLYGSFSKLIRSSFEDALPRFENGSVDLLHIDGYHTYEAVKNDFTNWLPKMSERGVILFHDTEVRDRDFGVWRFWQEIKTRYQHFEFAHGYGLGVLVVGKSPPVSLQKLLTASESDCQRIREFFHHLGSRLEYTWAAHQTIAEMQATLEEKDQELKTVTSSLEDRKEELRISASSLAREQEELRTSVSRLIKKQEELEEAARRLVEKENHTQWVVVQLADRERQLSKITSSLGWRALSRYGRIKYRYLLPLYRMLRLMPATEKVNESFLFSLDTLLPEELVIEKGNALYLSGWCFHTAKKIRGLEIILNGISHPVNACRLARRDVLDAHFPSRDPKGRSHRSGFWTILCIPQIEETVDACLQLKASFTDGSTQVEQLGKITLKTAY